MATLNEFPKHSGLYIAQKGNDVLLIKVTGMYPTLQLGKALALDKLITGNTLKEADKAVINNLLLFKDEWTYQPLPKINMTAFPKSSFRPDGMLDLEYDEFISMKSKYFRMLQSGCTLYQTTDALAQEYKMSLDQVKSLIEKFDL